MSLRTYRLHTDLYFNKDSEAVSASEEEDYFCDDLEDFHVEHMADEAAEEVIDGQGNEETSAGKNRLLHLVHEYVRLFNMLRFVFGKWNFLAETVQVMSSGGKKMGGGGVGRSDFRIPGHDSVMLNVCSRVVIIKGKKLFYEF